MHRQGKLLLTALTTVLVLALGAGTAMALRSLSITGEQTTTLNGRLTLIEQGRIICNVTMRKRFNRAIAKRANAQLGNVTGVTVGGCTTMPAETYRLNSITFLGVGLERLWQLLYKSFLGTLPDITGFLYVITRMQILVDATNMGLPVRCLFENPRENSIPMLAKLGNFQRIEELANLFDFPERQDAQLQRALEGSGRCERILKVELTLRPTQVTELVLI